MDIELIFFCLYSSCQKFYPIYGFIWRPEITRWCPHCVMVKELDRTIVISEFELHSHYHELVLTALNCNSNFS